MSVYDDLSGPYSRRRLEYQLREALAKAQTEYRQAQAKCARVTELCEDLGTGHPDGAYALRTAIKLERRSLQQFFKALKAFKALVIDGKRPDNVTEF